MSDAEEHTADRTAQFFEYFGQRHALAARQDVPLPDRLVVLAASLDALAKHWWDAFGKQSHTSESSTNRLRLFLVQHGGHPAFRKVSAPMLRQATGTSIGTFPFGEYRPNQLNEVRNWESDPDFDEGAGVVPRKILLRWSYPEILYVDLRCAWVHEFVPRNPSVHIGEADWTGRSEPYYRFVSPWPAQQEATTGRFMLMLPVAFLLNTMDNAVVSFRREATAARKLPFAD